MYINQNVKLKVGGRKAPKMSIKDLRDILLNGVIRDNRFNQEEYLEKEYRSKSDHRVIHISLDDPSWVTKYTELCNNPEFSEDVDYTFLSYIVYYGGWNIKFNKDLEKYTRDLENMEIRSWGLTTDNVPYIECKTYGDWELPICVYIYLDGKYFRGYIPTKGNCINLINRSAFGNNRGDFNILDSSSDRFDLSKYNKEQLDKFRKSDFYFLMSELFPSDSSKLVPSKENWELFYEKLEELEIDWDKCREDFFARLEAI